MENLSKYMVSKKTEHVMDSVRSLSETIPVSGFYEIGAKLRFSLNNLDYDINEFMSQANISKLKAAIKAKTKIEECEDYLKMAKNMRYANTDEILEELKELKSWLFLEAEIIRSKKEMSEFMEA